MAGLKLAFLMLLAVSVASASSSGADTQESSGAVVEDKVEEFNPIKPTSTYKPSNHYPEERKPRESYPMERKPRESYPMERKPRESYPEERKPRDSYPEERKPRESYPEERKPRESYPEERKPRESYPEERKPRESYPEERKPRDNHPEERKPREIYPEERKPRDSYPMERKPRDSYPEERKPRDSYPEERKPRDSYPEERKPRDSYPEERKMKYPYSDEPTLKYRYPSEPKPNYPYSEDIYGSYKPNKYSEIPSYYPDIYGTNPSSPSYPSYPSPPNSPGYPNYPPAAAYAPAKCSKQCACLRNLQYTKVEGSGCDFRTDADDCGGDACEAANLGTQSLAWCDNHPILCFQVTCPSAGYINIKGKPVSQVGCCGIMEITGSEDGTAGLFLYKGAYNASTTVPEEVETLVTDTADLDWSCSCEKHDTFSVCEKLGVIRKETLSFQFVGMSKDACPYGDTELVCAGGAYYQ